MADAAGPANDAARARLDAARRDAIVRQRVEETGIDETMIRTLVHAFYACVRKDPLLGPVFEAAVDDWHAHLAKLCDFWSSVALMSGRYSGKPMQAHALLPIGEAHFQAWLDLFRRTAAQVCPAAAAAFFIGRAEQIGQSLRLGLDLPVPPARERP